MIFYFDADQRRAAEASRTARARSGDHPGPVRTAIASTEPFHLAEEHHQRYYEKRGRMAESLFRS